MEIEVKSWLFNVLSAIEEIDSFFTDQPMTFEAYQNDVRTRRAVERNIEIIGEALNRILSKQPGINISNARRIVDTRNRIIHGYDTVSDEIIWSIIITYLPDLRKEVNALLGE
jgi:uncharacterized protein with HEPN domain